MGKMTQILGKIDCFDEPVETWPIYIERLDQYFAVNEIAEEFFFGSFVKPDGTKNIRFVENLTKQYLPSTKTYREVCEHFNKTSVT